MTHRRRESDIFASPSRLSATLTVSLQTEHCPALAHHPLSAVHLRCQRGRHRSGNATAAPNQRKLRGSRPGSPRHGRREERGRRCRAAPVRAGTLQLVEFGRYSGRSHPPPICVDIDQARLAPGAVVGRGGAPPGLPASAGRWLRRCSGTGPHNLCHDEGGARHASSELPRAGLQALLSRSVATWARLSPSCRSRSPSSPCACASRPWPSGAPVALPPTRSVAESGLSALPSHSHLSSQAVCPDHHRTASQHGRHHLAAAMDLHGRALRGVRCCDGQRATKSPRHRQPRDHPGGKVAQWLLTADAPFRRALEYILRSRQRCQAGSAHAGPAGAARQHAGARDRSAECGAGCRRRYAHTAEPDSGHGQSRPTGCPEDQELDVAAVREREEPDFECGRTARRRPVSLA